MVIFYINFLCSCSILNILSFINTFSRIFAQAGIDFDFMSLADEELLQKLWKASPLSHVNQVCDLYRIINNYDQYIIHSNALYHLSCIICCCSQVTNQMERVFSDTSNIDHYDLIRLDLSRLVVP